MAWLGFTRLTTRLGQGVVRVLKAVRSTLTVKRRRARRVAPQPVPAPFIEAEVPVIVAVAASPGAEREPTPQPEPSIFEVAVAEMRAEAPPKITEKTEQRDDQPPLFACWAMELGGQRK